MVIRLHQAHVATEDVVDLLRSCHERIRSFTRLAARLAGAVDATPEDVSDAAHQVRRYFSVALPLHAADEDEDLAPRIRGSDSAIDDALATMAADHRGHVAVVDRVVTVCSDLAREPAHLASRSLELGAIATELEALFAPHLALEERLVFPAIGTLPADDREAIRSAMRARRLT